MKNREWVSVCAVLATVLSLGCKQQRTEEGENPVGEGQPTAETKPPGATTQQVPRESAKATNPLLAPHGPAMSRKAPESFKAKFETNKGIFVIEVTRSWAPHGADRFFNLVGNGFYDGCRFFRVLSGFVAQFGINGDPEVSLLWRQASIPDDPVKGSNKSGSVTFAMAGPNTRTTQLFINYDDNSRLDTMGFSPIGKVVEGMSVVEGLYGEYGEGAPQGPGPVQERIQSEGNRYLQARFPNLDYIKKATIAPF